MSDTPETDAARLDISSDDSSCGIYCHTEDGSEYDGEVCRADRMADLEHQLAEVREENARLREAVKDARDCILRLLDNGHDDGLAQKAQDSQPQTDTP